MEDSPQEARSNRRSRDTSYKSKAFEKFKQLKKGLKNKYEVDEIDNVYEVVEEKQYVKEVLSRYDDDWIVDDDGGGYVEDGRDIFDDDLDMESIAQASAKSKGTKRKTKNVSENAGKGKIQQMLSSLPSKKKVETKIDDDEMLSEILGEIDSSPSTSGQKPKIKEYSALAKKLAAKDYMKNFSQPSKKRVIERKSLPNEEAGEVTHGSVLKEVQSNVGKSTKKPQRNVTEQTVINPFKKVKETPAVKQPQTEAAQEVIEETPLETFDDTLTEDFDDDPMFEELDKTPTPVASSQKVASQTIETDLTQDDFGDDFDVTQIEEFESQPSGDVEEASEKLSDELQAEFETEWGNFMNKTVDIDNTTEALLDKSDIPTIDDEGKKIFRFFWWDAYEDPLKQRGTVFLFGRTYCEKSKSFVSCCVAVRNIDRRLFVLPRPYELGPDGQPTDTPVTFKKMYEEFNDRVLKPIGVSTFRSRQTSKKYAFDPNIPQESEYMEVRYPANDPKIDADLIPKKTRTFSKIFGVNTSFLEIFFLERKIKGPCWLDISNPVPVTNPLSWCKFEVNCTKMVDLKVTVTEKPLPPPPLVVTAINIRTCINRKTCGHEIVMASCLTHKKYAVDMQPPDPPFQQHFCVIASPGDQTLPFDIHDALSKYKATKVQKMDSEKGLLNFFVNQFSSIDPDLIVGHDLQGYQINILAERLSKLNTNIFNKLGRLKRSEKKNLEKSLFAGRLVCDIKISAKELIKSRSYDLDALCQVVLKLNENQRIELEPDDVPKMFKTTSDILKLISFTMQDTMYILKIMYNLNVIPLALQITNIAGNVMSKTLMGGRSERNEFLLLHAFSEKGYILPDKEYKKRGDGKQSSKKKPTYAGGLVLDPKVGFYDNLILLMDFNSLYPSIIQEYNICFTTLPISDNDENLFLPDSNLPPGVLPTEIRKLVESRRQVKGMMKKPDISLDLRMQYDIRQMALKLTANSMYGCLGFSNSRFYAKNLAALVTQKGREILTNTRDMIEKMNFNVVYGDTDSIMINTNILEYDQVFKIGVKIKQEVNKLYKQVELDIDGVFKYLLLLKKKKYAAVTLNKDKNGKLVAVKEYKGLDIVRRDWSQISSEAGKYILNQILSDQSADERIEHIREYLRKIREHLTEGKVPTPLLIITKQLTKEPHMYPDKNSLPHVLVALRYNQKSGGHFRAGDTVPYIICEDGTTNSAVQRAYHVDELKSNSELKVDVMYYLGQQIHPVVSRICEPIEGIDSYEIAECLGLDTKNIKRPRQAVNELVGENISRPEVKFRNVDKFKFICYGCKQDNIVEGALVGNAPFLERCRNADCSLKPIDYLPSIQNQLTLSIQSYINKYYENILICEDPACTNETNRLPLKFARKYPICTLCQKGVMFRVYNEQQLYTQLSYFQHIFDLSKLSKKPLMEQEIESGYSSLQDVVEKYLNHSGYSIIDLTDLFSMLDPHKKRETTTIDVNRDVDEDVQYMDEDEEEDV
ncbi:DNA polymerase alpha catalytic subunit [Diabrotica virgifera virgifera]|uniref:DNA polymerase n=1 Tax=Diabrotica virgifera virgifera TaxID=50390 RepID=A0ABM5KU40_DIAVI|nr:DNA polymerase alpha catalytic subunit [Diabrotica virgifera virgifera]